MNCEKNMHQKIRVVFGFQAYICKFEIVEDPNLEKKLYEDCPWLHDVRNANPNQKIFIFRIAHGEAQYWNMALNCKER